MLKVEDVHVSIGSVKILRGTALEVLDGQFVGLIGRNGAGKTTLFRAIMGLLPIRRGRITFGGRALNEVPAHHRAKLGIGYMPEDRRIIPDLTVEENILLPAWSVGLKDADQRLARVYDLIPELKEHAPRKGMQLSGGQQKLAALARALMCGTRLLLLDEPFEGVAPVLARRLAQVIARLKGEGMSVVLAESDVSHAHDLLDSIYGIDRGEVTRAGEHHAAASEVGSVKSSASASQPIAP